MMEQRYISVRYVIREGQLLQRRVFYNRVIVPCNFNASFAGAIKMFLRSVTCADDDNFLRDDNVNVINDDI